jgi:hypothetical protein
MASPDRFGFGFWLGWICWFAGSLILAAIFWTAVIIWQFGRIEGAELTLSWALAVFGSWFILVIPFMRKKEQIWKRLNLDQEKALEAWLKAMGIFVGLLVASALGWSLILKKNLGQNTGTGLDPVWAKAVFGTWLFFLFPFLIWMYKTADRIFKSAVIRQTQTGPSFKTVMVEKSKRLLPKRLAAKIAGCPPTLEKGHVVTLVAKDGSKIQDVFVLNSSEVLGLYNREKLDFNPYEMVDVECLDSGMLPPYEESKWLRLDGRS